MKTGTKFDSYTDETLEEFQIEDTDSFENYRSYRYGVYEGTFDHTLNYPIGNTTLAARTIIIPSYPATVNFKSNLLVSGLPLDCIYRINSGKRAMSTSGIISLVATEKLYTIEIIGKYYHANIVIPVIDPIEAARQADSKWIALETATPTQINNWIDSNITDLASARNLLKTLVLAIRYLHDRSN